MILVDQIKPRSKGPRCFRAGSCHLASDTGRQELLVAAAALGLPVTGRELARKAARA